MGFMLRSISGQIKADIVTVTTTAIALATDLANTKTKLIYNNGTNTVYLGDSAVTVAKGYPLFPGDEKGFDIEAGVILYGIVDSGTSEVRVLDGE